MLDANIIISAIHIPDSNIGKMVSYIENNHTIVLCQYIIDEIKFGFQKKMPHKANQMLKEIERLPFEMYVLKKINESLSSMIRDKNDIEVLANVIESDVDIFITGDNDFHCINLSKPKILRPRQFIEEFIKT